MPIRPGLKRHYGEQWGRIAAGVKTAADWKCQECGMQCRRPAEPFDTHKRTLTVAHLNHVAGDNRPENLRALCAGCHNRYDAKKRAQNRRSGI